MPSVFQPILFSNLYTPGSLSLFPTISAPPSYSILSSPFFLSFTISCYIVFIKLLDVFWPWKMILLGKKRLDRTNNHFLKSFFFIPFITTCIFKLVRSSAKMYTHKANINSSICIVVLKLSHIESLNPPPPSFRLSFISLSLSVSLSS